MPRDCYLNDHMTGADDIAVQGVHFELRLFSVIGVLAFDRMCIFISIKII